MMDTILFIRAVGNRAVYHRKMGNKAAYHEDVGNKELCALAYPHSHAMIYARGYSYKQVYFSLYIYISPPSLSVYLPCSVCLPPLLCLSSSPALSV